MKKTQKKCCFLTTFWPPLDLAFLGLSGGPGPEKAEKMAKNAIFRFFLKRLITEFSRFCEKGDFDPKTR